MNPLPVWRLCTAKHAATAYDGEGARLYGGRWSPKGIPLTYTAESRALAVVEVLATAVAPTNQSAPASNPATLAANQPAASAPAVQTASPTKAAAVEQTGLSPAPSAQAAVSTAPKTAGAASTQNIIGDLGRPEVSMPLPMNDPKFQQHGGDHAAEHPPHGPYWKRMHHSPFFWVAAFFIMLAMIIYVTSNDLAFWPGKKAQPPVPALAP